MILSKAPLRVSFFGGGSDIPAHYTQWGGSTISMAIDRYVYVAIMHTPSKHIKVSYSKQECVTDIEDLQNEIVKNVLGYFNIRSNIEITSFADIPTIGTGLGASSAFTCALIKAVLAYIGMDDVYNSHDVADLACHVELDMCGWKIGKQDQYASAMGGMNYIKYTPEGRIFVHKMNPSFIEPYMTLIPTKIDRHASDILGKIDFNDHKKTFAIRELSHMADLTWNQEMTAKQYGDQLNAAWILKKQMDDGITNTAIDQMYERCMKAGAWGAKLLGAGGGGYMLALTDDDPALHEEFEDRDCLTVQCAHEGAKIVYRD